MLLKQDDGKIICVFRELQCPEYCEYEQLKGTPCSYVRSVAAHGAELKRKDTEKKQEREKNGNIYRT